MRSNRKRNAPSWATPPPRLRALLLLAGLLGQTEAVGGPPPPSDPAVSADYLSSLPNYNVMESANDGFFNPITDTTSNKCILTDPLSSFTYVQLTFS